MSTASRITTTAKVAALIRHSFLTKPVTRLRRTGHRPRQIGTTSY